MKLKKNSNFLDKISKSKFPYVIAEIGINHNGDLTLAKKMILSAKKSGANCVKFQSFKADKLISKYAPKANYQKKYKKTQLELIKSCEFKIEKLRELKNFARKKKIDFLCTPFESSSLKELLNIGIPAIKISSDNINNIPFLIEASKTKLPILLSTGMANLKEVGKAVKIFKKTKNPLLLFQCTSNYPSSIENSNLKVLKTFKKRFKCLVGLSDHTKSFLPPIIAISLGALVIEKHFTLSRKLKGIDQQASLEPNELKDLIDKCRETIIALGNSLKSPTSEEANSIKTARRSLVASKDLKKGIRISNHMFEIKRPGTGISPENFKKIIGMRLLKDKKEDQVIFWKDLK
tara:strand:+ start:313 stop:1356 length:1044 start_codon:yes stop_codon:yes gene_type:complete